MRYRWASKCISLSGNLHKVLEKSASVAPKNTSAVCNSKYRPSDRTLTGVLTILFLELVVLKEQEAILCPRTKIKLVSCTVMEQVVDFQTLESLRGLAKSSQKLKTRSLTLSHSKKTKTTGRCSTKTQLSMPTPILRSKITVTQQVTLRFKRMCH